MSRRRGLLCAAIWALVALAAQPREPLKSGPQRATAKIGAFNPLNVTGEHAGKKHSLVAGYGARPVVLVLARGVSDELGALLKKVEAAAAKHEKAELAAFAVVCSDDEKMKGRLEGLAKSLGLKRTVLAVLADKAGPKGYDFHPDAEVMVVLYARRNARAQFAYKKGELKDGDIDAVLADIAKVLPAGKK